MTNSVITIVHSIEDDYGMDSDNWSENDARLKKLREWYIKHPDEKKRNSSYRNIQRIQKSLDKQIPKKKICEIFETSRGKLIHDIKIGILNDTKWKAVRKVKQ